MPKSKRDKKVSLTKTSKKTFKQRMAQDIKWCADNYACAFTFTVENMRNAKLKDVRMEWRHSRFFFGKNKLLMYGLGKFPEVEVQKNIHKLARELKGQCGLLFTNKPKDEVVEWFKTYQDVYHARSGDIAREKVSLEAGPLPQFPHCMEPHLREQGFPVTLERGVVTLLKDFTVCKKGDTLTPAQSRMLKLLDIRMAYFRLNLGAVWTNDGNFEILKVRSLSNTEGGTQRIEQEEMEMEDESKSDDE